MSKYNHRVVKMGRPDNKYHLIAKNYINPETGYIYRNSYYLTFGDEVSAKREAEKLIKNCQEIHLYNGSLWSPYPNYEQFEVLSKKGIWKIVKPTNRTKQIK